MCQLNRKDDAIEGKRINIAARKYVAHGVVNIKGIGLCYKYVCTINAKAEINTSLEVNKPYHFNDAKLDVGLYVYGDTLDIVSCRLLNAGYGANYSNTHGIQLSNTKKFGAAKIRTPFRFLLDSQQATDNTKITTSC